MTINANDRLRVPAHPNTANGLSSLHDIAIDSHSAGGFSCRTGANAQQLGCYRHGGRAALAGAVHRNGSASHEGKSRRHGERGETAGAVLATVTGAAAGSADALLLEDPGAARD